MLEYDWLLKALICGIIGCFMVKAVRFDLSDDKHLSSDRSNWSVKQPMKIKQFMLIAKKL